MFTFEAGARVNNNDSELDALGMGSQQQALDDRGAGIGQDNIAILDLVQSQAGNHLVRHRDSVSDKVVDLF